jgi:D-lactate dehydrogenase
MKIIFFETSPQEKETLAPLLSDQGAVFYEDKLTLENSELAKDVEIISIFINSKITKEIVDSLPNLKCIVTRSTGYDHIDLAYLKTKGIALSNVPAYGSQTVAEYAFALLLNLSRKVFDACHQIKEGGNFSISALQGFDLSGKTLGVIGTGRIGKNVIHIARGFNMNVVAFDMFPDEAFAKENNFVYKNFLDVIKESDVITLHAPYTKENHHLINKEAVDHMKKGVYIINTARGELIDTSALISGLKDKTIAGAGLDVLEGEREIKDEMELLSSAGKMMAIESYKMLLEDHVLMDMPQVIITPHIAFFSKEAEMSILKTTVENIKNFINGAPQNLVK